MRISELAKELGIESQVIIAYLASEGYDNYKPSSKIEEYHEEMVREHFPTAQDEKEPEPAARKLISRKRHLSLHEEAVNLKNILRETFDSDSDYDADFDDADSDFDSDSDSDSEEDQDDTDQAFLDSLSENEMDLYIRPARPGRDGKNDQFVQKLNGSMKELKRLLPNLPKQPANENVELLITKIFRSNMPTTFFIRNLSYDNLGKQNENKIVGLRCYREEGDWLETELAIPISKTLLFEGGVIFSGKILSINEIHLISNDTETLPFEKKITAINRVSDRYVKNPFLLDILQNLPSLVRNTSKKLSEWEGYLNWMEKLAQLRVKGCKYIGVQFDHQKKYLIFVLVAKNEEYFKQVFKYLTRGSVQAYENSYSTDPWEFKYPQDSKQKRRQKRGVDLGTCMKEKDRFTLEQENGRLDSIFINNDESSQESETAVTRDNIIKAYGDNPWFLRLQYGLNQDDDENLDLVEANGDDVESFINQIVSEYPPNGFLACSEIGNFALINRFRKTINNMKNGETFSPRLGEWLFDIHEARLPESEPEKITHWLNPNIAKNPNQVEAIEKMLNAPDVFMLQGPPGTGKTTVIAEAIYQFVIRGLRVLVSSQSNDAVDNALERLVKTPEIRAIRLDPRKQKDFLDEDSEKAAEKLSEDTALQFYYQSLSEKISAELSEWANSDKKSEEYDKDMRDLQFVDNDISDLQKELENANKERSDFTEKKTKLKKQFREANDKNQQIIDEKSNLELFENFVSSPEADIPFFLSDSQLEIVAKTLKPFLKLSEQEGLILGKFDPSTENKTQNQSLMLIVKNIEILEGFSQSLSKNTGASPVNPEIRLLERQRNEINEKLGEDISDEKADSLAKELYKIIKKIRDLKKNSGSCGFSISENQKLILDKTLRTALAKNPESVKAPVNKILSEAKKILPQLVSALKTYSSSLQKIDTDEIDKQIKSVDGKLRVNEENRQKIQQKLSSKRNITKSLSEKYFGKDAPVAAIEDILAQIDQKKQEHKEETATFATLRNDWENTLSDFKKQLETHATDRMLIENDKDNYMLIYMKSCNVVGVSCTADPRTLSDKDFNDFDVVIIDEVSKATPPELLIPLMKGRKVVLVGDHRQLPPAFGENESSYQQFVDEVQNSDDYTEEEKELISDENFKRFEKMVTASLFKDYFESADNRIKATLLTQYRMHSDIMDIINKFYEDRLQCGIIETQDKTRAHNLSIKTLNGKDFITPAKHAYWIDSSRLPDGRPFYDSKIGTGTSSCNFLEEALTFELLKKIAHEYRQKGYGGLEKKAKDRKTVSIGIISFYALSMQHLRSGVKKLRKANADDFSAVKIKTSTVDRFQGQEKNIIIATLVRNWSEESRHRMSKHITAFERINVAFSRAQNLLFIVGAKDLFNRVPVTLTGMDSGKEHTSNVYSGIMTRLNQKGCFFESDALLDQKQAEEIFKKWQNNSSGDKPWQKKHHNFKKYPKKSGGR